LYAVGPLDIATAAAGGRLIEAGAESAPGTGDDDGADLRIGFGFVERVMSLF
jgi:hypothetical protein